MLRGGDIEVNGRPGFRVGGFNPTGGQLFFPLRRVVGSGLRFLVFAVAHVSGSSLSDLVFSVVGVMGGRDGGSAGGAGLRRAAGAAGGALPGLEDSGGV